MRKSDGSRPAAKSGRQLAVFLLGTERLAVEVFEAMLSRERFRVAGSASTMSGLPFDRAQDSPAVLVILAENAHDFREEIVALRTSRPNISVLFLVRRAEAAIDPMGGAFACLPTSSSRELVLATMELLPSGCTVVTPEALMSLVQERRPLLAPPQEAPAAGTCKLPIALTPSETSVLQHLAVGAPNRDIANAMGLAEPTVKVHVKAVLRKIGAANRTQAATWVHSNGLPAPDHTLRRPPTRTRVSSFCSPPRPQQGSAPPDSASLLVALAAESERARVARQQ